MKNKTKNNRLILPTSASELKWHNFDDLLAKELKNKEFRQAFEHDQERRALARQIRATRMVRKLTQQSVAKKASMPQSAIARLESGDHGVSLDTLSRVAHALGKRVEIV